MWKSPDKFDRFDALVALASSELGGTPPISKSSGPKTPPGSPPRGRKSRRSRSFSSDSSSSRSSSCSRCSSRSRSRSYSSTSRSRSSSSSSSSSSFSRKRGKSKPVLSSVSNNKSSVILSNYTPILNNVNTVGYQHIGQINNQQNTGSPYQQPSAVSLLAPGMVVNQHQNMLTNQQSSIMVNQQQNMITNQQPNMVGNQQQNGPLLATPSSGPLLATPTAGNTQNTTNYCLVNSNTHLNGGGMVLMSGANTSFQSAVPIMPGSTISNNVVLLSFSQPQNTGIRPPSNPAGQKTIAEQLHHPPPPPHALLGMNGFNKQSQSPRFNVPDMTKPPPNLSPNTAGHKSPGHSPSGNNPRSMFVNHPPITVRPRSEGPRHHHRPYKQPDYPSPSKYHQNQPPSAMGDGGRFQPVARYSVANVRPRFNSPQGK